ncbi:methylated-DNA--[protein]-cysteine S-methyltransferase [Pararoseomonas indoligenes]|uniref:Methylated-DNA--[protein]-cysteine S-methyltransferase n=1 Tax=Roseomonas indoligenes TaxID=2820811 RepID=A0A940MYX7_9PROT|nr:methylated-DNA--[protein]-cysteine S-methyltransferase [Pararoseomonas indoligenes]MBP0495919.1 methylated-DNA--[protein]-cysteine S-methyltransferase [Pararoseomonas indoligenes]
MSDDVLPFAADTIHYGYHPTTTGLAAVAVSRRGVAAVLLGADRNELSRKLAEALPGADVVENGTAIGPVLSAVACYLDAPTGEPGFDLDMRGNAGELAVWTALRAIPSGETRTYGALARAIGTGLTAQEVGAACAANRLAVVVPCHRVLKADGSISGYRWGVHRKRRLLALEKAA